jgi:hypothetical protein
MALVRCEAPKGYNKSSSNPFSSHSAAEQDSSLFCWRVATKSSAYLNQQNKELFTVAGLFLMHMNG